MKKRFGKEPRELSIRDKALCLMNLCEKHGVTAQHVVDLYYYYAITAKMDKDYLRKDFFGTLPINIKDCTPSVIREAHEAKIDYYRNKVNQLNLEAGIDKWFILVEGRDFGMTNRKPPQYNTWDYPKDKEYPNTLFGFHTNKVIRWMGADVWTFDEVRTSFYHYGVEVPHAVIKEQLEKGRKGEKVDPDLLEPDDVEDLYASKKYPL